MQPGERFSAWVDGIAMSWKDRFTGWGESLLINAGNKFLESAEPQTKTLMRASVQKLIDDPNTTPELKAVLEDSLAKGDWVATLTGYLGMFVGSIIGITAVAGPPGRVQAYAVDRIVQGFRFDPQSVMIAWRRDPVKFIALLEDLKDLGFDDARITALKEITKFVPSAQDQINWLAREVFEPEMRERYGLGSELPNYEDTDFSKIGVDAKQMANYWAAHWEHASFMQVTEMLHRGTLSLEKSTPTPPTTPAGWAARDAEGTAALYDWYRLVEIPPFWRDRLTEMSWNVPTRVDVRRWWEMRTIPESELYNVYHRMGYHGKDLDNYVLWTKVYTDYPALLARYKNGWITIEDVKAELINMGMSADRAETLLQEKIRKEAPERVAVEKNLTKAEIVKGVKKGVITRAEGIELLQDMGYGPDEANYIMAINLEVLTGSPHNFAEFRDLTQGYRIAVGMEGKPMPEDIKETGAEVVRLSDDVKALQASIKKEQDLLIPDGILPEAATARVKELQATLYAAQAELTRVQTDYRAKIAEWRHKAGV